MSDRTCVLCGGEIRTDAQLGKGYDLTDNERLVFRAMYQGDPARVEYCNPCFRLMSNREAGAQVLRGMVETRLRTLGVVDAAQRAQRFYERLLERAASKPLS